MSTPTSEIACRFSYSFVFSLRLILKVFLLLVDLLYHVLFFHLQSYYKFTANIGVDHTHQDVLPETI